MNEVLANDVARVEVGWALKVGAETEYCVACGECHDA